MELEQGWVTPALRLWYEYGLACRLSALFLKPTCPFKQTSGWEWCPHYFCCKEQNSVITKALFSLRVAVNGPSGLLPM